jgi:hypothetical protein
MVNPVFVYVSTPAAIVPSASNAPSIQTSVCVATADGSAQVTVTEVVVAEESVMPVGVNISDVDAVTVL